MCMIKFCNESTYKYKWSKKEALLLPLLLLFFFLFLLIYLDPSPRRICKEVIGWLGSTSGGDPPDVVFDGTAGGVLTGEGAEEPPSLWPVPSKGLGGALGGGT